MVGRAAEGVLLQALHRYQNNLARTGENLARLATGQRINRGGDDPAGLINASRLAAALATLEAESYSLQRSDQIAATAEGALREVSNLLTDTHGLEVQLANGGALSEAEREAIQQQIDYRAQSIDRIAAGASFNGRRLFDGTVSLSVGSSTLDLPSFSAASLGATEIDGQTYHLAEVTSGGPLSGDAAGAQQVIANAATQVASLRGSIGAFQHNAISPTLTANRVAVENLAAARSQIADTDYAAETVSLLRNEVLGKAAIGALSMALASRDDVLALLG